MTYTEEKKTERLFIRKLDISDIKYLIKFFLNPEAIKYIPSRGIPETKDKASEFILRQIKRYNVNLFGQMALILKVNNKFIGTCGLLSQKIDNIDEIEIAYRILPEYWNNGYATEAAKKFIDLAFENNWAESVTSIIDKRNIASQKVAMKNGMKLDKETVYSGLKVFIYRIINYQWKQLSSGK